MQRLIGVYTVYFCPFLYIIKIHLKNVGNTESPAGLGDHIVVLIRVQKDIVFDEMQRVQNLVRYILAAVNGKYLQVSILK